MQQEVVDLVRAVHAARLSHRAALDQLALKRAEFESAHAELIAKTKDLSLLVADSEEALRELAQRFRPEIGWLKEHPEDRWVGPGVEVKVVHDVLYDEATAVQYAIDHKLTNTLAIKKREFEKVARAIGGDVGVQVTESAKVYLATDFGAHLSALDELGSAPEEVEVHAAG